MSIDGTGVHVTNVAVGSHRYRVTFKGPGGHSFGAFGLANPIDAMGRAIAKIAEFQVPQEPKTTFNVGRVGGGTSVNSIPFEGWMEVDMRSSDPASLAVGRRELSESRRRAVVRGERALGHAGHDHGDEGARRRSAGGIDAGGRADRQDRPRRGARRSGSTATLGEGSTDANMPMSLGIPAIDDRRRRPRARTRTR